MFVIPNAEHCNIFVVPTLTMLLEEDGCILKRGGCICPAKEKNVFVNYKRKGGQRHVWVKVCLSFSASGSIHHIHRLACLETLMFVFGQVAMPIQLERSKKENEQLHILITDLHPNDYGVSHYH